MAASDLCGRMDPWASAYPGETPYRSEPVHLLISIVHWFQVKKEYRILVVEKTAADVVSINHQLRKSGVLFRSKRVDSEDAFRHELEHHCPDLIVSRQSTSTMDPASILALVRESSMSVPVIFLTGTPPTGGEPAVSVSCTSDEPLRVLETSMEFFVPAVRQALFGGSGPHLPHAARLVSSP